MPPRPPMPEPISTPVSISSSYVRGSQSASRKAWVAAAIPKMMKSSTLRCSLGSIQSSGWNASSAPPRGTCPAIWHGRSETSKFSTLSIRRLARQQPTPCRLHAGSDGRDHSKAGDDNSPHGSLSTPDARLSEGADAIGQTLSERNKGRIEGRPSQSRKSSMTGLRAARRLHLLEAFSRNFTASPTVTMVSA